MILSARVDREVEQIKRDFKLQRHLNHELANWIYFAFHNPKKMPKIEDDMKPAKRVAQSPEEIKNLFLAASRNP